MGASAQLGGSWVLDRQGRPKVLCLLVQCQRAGQRVAVHGWPASSASCAGPTLLHNGCTLLAASGLLAALTPSLFTLARPTPCAQVVSGRRHVGLVDVQPVGSYAVR